MAPGVSLADAGPLVAKRALEVMRAFSARFER